MGDFWVFGYGSLMWRPGFAHRETQKAHLSGYRRALCITSHIHRGSVEKPGLVLGLDRGGSCVGLAFRVPGELTDEVMAYLRQRELITNVYLEKRLPIRLEDGSRVQAVTYVTDRSHIQYAGQVDVEEAARRVCGSVGLSGRNEDYVLNTIQHLTALGIRDRWLENVARHLTLPDEQEAPPQAP
ncbi:gamma-glutamylcyclotransferase [Aquamicrobium zhengzhouense]|uniref:glutathione-specific gamma-glutamylcyclotransferase n=1 Tax=Aquamicrobium zhengzhouense TaxID=2781738 RepID=A0ABS0SG46_9HYPH|nr:gamma-glutamylcyclotransferase [Aquamicrobium zhengzhouense]MBI1621437.1 gamma-glutamylcyclotransferase [Aquamicrobium zhengzhouense]